MDNNKIERQNIKIEKTPQMSNGFKIHTKSLFSLQPLLIIHVQSFNVFSIMFSYKNLFLLFLIHDLRDKKERLPDFNNRERKMILTLILTTKIVDLGIKWFYLVKRVLLMYFCASKLPKKSDMSSKRFFYFRFILYFCVVFLRLFTYLSRCSDSFLSVLGQELVGK